MHQKETDAQKRSVRTNAKEHKQQSVRLRRYYDDYQLQMRAKMTRQKTKEEMASVLW